MLDLAENWNQLPSRNALMEKRETRTMGAPPPPEVQPPWDIPEAVVVTAAVSGRIVHDFQDDVATRFPLDIGSFQTAAIETIEAGACSIDVDFGGINAIAQTGMSVPQIYDRIVSGIDAGTERDRACDVNVLRGETFAENMFPISAGLGETAPMAPKFPVDWMEAVAQGETDKNGQLFFSTHSTHSTAETLGRRLATAAEYRSLLGMPETGIRSG